jgi:chemotaxis protein methyltransferase CheR
MSAAAARADRNEVLVTGEFPFTQADFRTVAALLHGMAGITLPDSKATLVYSRLAKRLRALHLESFSDYCDLVASDRGADEKQAMLAALTTNVTRFFREPHHFDHLRTHVIEPLAAAARNGRRIRIWSAGCSTGQEPYTIALTLLDVLPEAPQLDVKILATDIDPNVVATAREAVYADDLIEGVPLSLRSRWLDRRPGGEWAVKDAARGLVTAKVLNLMEPWPMKGPFDAIFCRNVVIYFDEPTQERMWSRFAPLLAPGGRLYVGHSERASYPGSILSTDGLTTYKAPGTLA